MMSHLAEGPLANAPALRYFSLARYALAAGLRALGLTSGARVLLPEYICRDLLAALHLAGAIPVFYPVDESLAPASPSERWVEAEAVLIVNYFGFAQDLAPFEQYRNRTGAKLIEDNAHGFLSRDSTGRWLGRRADAGLFSLRKTFWFDNGAALVLEAPSTALAPQLEETEAAGVSAIRLRRWLHCLPAGRAIAAVTARAARCARALRTGHAIAPPAADAETIIPGDPNPARGLTAQLAVIDAATEISRRRALYTELALQVCALRMRPVFECLPDGAAPYGIPVYCDDPAPLIKIAASRYLDCFRWPDLPDAFATTAPAHYRRIHVVNFL